MDPRWYESFFQGIVVDMWRRAVSPEQTRREADFLARALELKPGDRVLDVPCGLGRHALELASRGFRPTGVDLSPEMIREAEQGARGRGLDVRWVKADMRDLASESEYDAAYCFGNSFGYFDPGGTRDFMRAVSRALKPGGRFALDYGMAAECILPRLREREWSPAGDILFLEENRYDAREGRVATTYTFIRGGKTETRTGLQWVYTVREIGQLLHEAGLRMRDLHGSLEGGPFEVGAPCLYLVAEKRRETDIESP